MSGRGSVYQRPKSTGRWTAHVTWVDTAGERRQLKRGGFKSRKEAEQELTRMLGRIDLGVMVPPDRLIVEAWLEAWLEHVAKVVGRTPATVNGYRRALWPNAIPVIGQMRMQQVGPEDINRVFRRMAGKDRPCSASTIRNVYRVLRKSFADAERAGIVATNIVPRSSPPSSTAARAPKFPTWRFDELSAFLEHIQGDWFAPVLTALILTGARRGEICALRWADVDLEQSQLVIAHSITELPGGIVEGDTKSHRSRPVALDLDLVELLRLHRKDQEQWKFTVGAGWIDRDLVFPGPDGDFLKPNSLSRNFGRLVAAAPVPKIRLHDLRHTHATLMVESGRDAKTVSERLGHSTVAFTLDRYVKPSLDAQHEAANDFAARLRTSRR